MPYIKQEDRNKFKDLEMELGFETPKTAGELQYVIAVMIKAFMSESEGRYQDMNNVMGALNGANLEFYRRTVAPYEDLCIALNGDVL